jgi:NAD(P)-dependent dehydrogenase (short-subunit alcohol dehydrogenase family)
MSSQKTLVITGASKGIGRAVLEHAATSNKCECVVGIVRPGSRHFEELKKKFNGNQKVKIFEGDVTDFNSLKKIADHLKQQKIDIVLSNAGTMTPRKPIWEVTEQELEQAYKVDVLGALNTMKVYIPVMKNNANSVIATVSGDWGLCDNYGCATFCMAKYAVEGLTKAAALDCEKEQVSVCTVSPGSVVTELLIQATGSEQEARKIGTPVEEFAPQFFDKLFNIGKKENGQHLDFSVKKAARAG